MSSKLLVYSFIFLSILQSLPLNQTLASNRSGPDLKQEHRETLKKHIIVTGQIVSEENAEPIPGVTILIKGTTTGTVSDINGNYTIDVPDENGILVFSSIGYASR